MAPVSKRALALAAVFCLIPLLNFPLALVSDRTLFLRDIGMVWAPQLEAVVRQVGHGEFPFFDARRAFGQPLFADPRAEVLYPPAWIHWILPVERSYAIFCAFHLVVAALGAARLTRRVMGDASLAAQATAGLAYGAGGPLLSLVSHWHHLAAAAWMPWILERAYVKPGKGVPWVSLSGLVALQIFAGSPDYSFTTLVLCLLLTITRTERPLVERARVLLAISLGISLSAIQLLPSLAFSREAARDPDPIGWALSPLHPALTIETILPIRAFSWPLRPEARVELFENEQVWMFSHYLGLSVWALALLGFLGGTRVDRKFAIGCIVLGLVFAWGVRNPALQALLSHAPIVPNLRFPTKHLAAASLGLALLSAAGVMTAQWTATARRCALAAAALSLIAFAGLYYWGQPPAGRFEPGVLARPILAFACFLGILFGGSVTRRWSLVPLLVALDLLGAHSRINPTTPVWAFRGRPPLSSVLPAGSRLYVSDYSITLRDTPLRLPDGPPYRLAKIPAGLSLNESTVLAATWYFNPPTAGRFGYYGSFDLDILDFYRAPLKKMIREFVTSRDPDFVLDRLRRGSVDYVVTMDPKTLWSSLPMVAEETRFFEAPVRVYKVPAPWPRARLETPDGALSAESPRILEMLDGRIRIEAANSRRAQLVIAFANDQGWKARVDGRRTPLSDHEMALLAVPLEAGHHLVELLYEPPLFKLAAALSALSLIAVLGLSNAHRISERGKAR